jgi:hypothetical protein
LGASPTGGSPPARPALRTSSPKGSYVRQLLGLTANPPCTQHRATHNGGKVLEMKRVNKESAQPSKSQALPVSSFCCLRCIFESERRGLVKKSPTACSLAVPHKQRKEMKRAYLLIIPFITVLNSTFGQLQCDFKIISEVQTDEELDFIEEIFGDGEKKKYRNRIIRKTSENDVLKLLIGVKSFEKGDLFCESEMSNDTLFLQFRVRGKVIDGIGKIVEIGESKYREVEIEVNGLNASPKVILLNGEEVEESSELYLTYPIQFEIVDGDTVNRKDEFGQRQGRWIDKMDRVNIESYYVDSKLMKSKMTTMNLSNNVESEEFYNLGLKTGDVYFRSYYETGEIQEENYIVNETGIFKRKWNLSGEIIQENLYNGEEIEINQYDKKGELYCKCITKIGAESFVEEMGISWAKNKYKIPCTFYDKYGNEVSEGKKEFKLNYEINPR